MKFWSSRRTESAFELCPDRVCPCRIVVDLCSRFQVGSVMRHNVAACVCVCVCVFFFFIRFFSALLQLLQFFSLLSAVSYSKPEP